MKFQEIRAFQIDISPRPQTTPRAPSRAQTYHLARPINRYEKFRGAQNHVSYAG